MMIGGSAKRSIKNRVFGRPGNLRTELLCPHLGQIAIHPGLHVDVSSQSEDVNEKCDPDGHHYEHYHWI